MGEVEKKAGTGSVPAGAAGRAEVEAFVRQARASALKGGGGRLILALDATLSRQPTWDLACQLQAEMFDAAGSVGGLQVQLVYFRGIGECRTSRFVTESAQLKRLMSGIDCRGGYTQLIKVLTHARNEHGKGKVQALVYIGDAFEEEADTAAARAGELGLLGVPVFVFQEGSDKTAEAVFREIARLSRGAWFRFDRTAAKQLKELLSAIGLYAAGGRPALTARDRPGDRLLLSNLGGGAP